MQIVYVGSTLIGNNLLASDRIISIRFVVYKDYTAAERRGAEREAVTQLYGEMVRAALDMAPDSSIEQLCEMISPQIDRMLDDSSTKTHRFFIARH